MEQLTSIEQLQGLIAEIRNMRKGYVTNFYLDAFKHKVWIESGDFKFERINDTLFFSRESEDFCNLFYCSTTTDELATALKLFGEKYSELQKMIDVVGADAQCEPILNILHDNGYTEYRQLIRMSRMTPETAEIKNEHVAYATVEESAEVRKLLNTYFDAKCEQIPMQKM